MSVSFLAPGALFLFVQIFLTPQVPPPRQTGQSSFRFVGVPKCSPKCSLSKCSLFAIVYNLIRQVMISAAHRQKVAVNRISFIDALRWLQIAQEADELTNLVVLPLRPYRYEPRVRKRRPKKYKLMTKPRNELKQELASQ